MESEQHTEARARIQTAIEDFLRLGDGNPDDAHPLDESSVLAGWAIIAHVPPIENIEESVYWTVYSSESVPTHAAMGLFSLGVKLVLEQANF
jgi:hypothetical protein